jgi:hypothetical protein
MADGGIYQDTERNRPSSEHSPTGNSRRRDLSEHGKKNRPSKAHSLSGDDRGRDSSGYGKKPSERDTLTPWRQQREELVRTRKETERAWSTHKLVMAQGETCQDMERNRPSEVHSLSGVGRGGDLSGNGKTRPKEAHSQTGDGRGTRQDTERTRPSEAHSHPGDGRGRNSSGYENKPTERGTLTS